MPISFSEIWVILLVALLVIKPERLPEVALTVGRCIQWLRAAATKIKREMEESFEQVTAEKSVSSSSHHEQK